MRSRSTRPCFERAAERVERLDGATVLSHPTLPDVPHLNLAHVARRRGRRRRSRPSTCSASRSPTRRVAAELRARGWDDETTLLLGRDGALEPPAAGALAEEVPYGHVRGLRDEWIRSGAWATSEDIVRDAHEGDRRLFAGTPTRSFATFEQGRPLAYALLLDDGRDGMLEDVYTTPSARGRGLATAVIAAVLHAARAERHELVFVPTDVEGGARRLYEAAGLRAPRRPA